MKCSGCPRILQDYVQPANKREGKEGYFCRHCKGMIGGTGWREVLLKAIMIDSDNEDEEDEEFRDTGFTPKERKRSNEAAQRIAPVAKEFQIRSRKNSMPTGIRENLTPEQKRIKKNEYQRMQREKKKSQANGGQAPISREPRATPAPFQREVSSNGNGAHDVGAILAKLRGQRDGLSAAIEILEKEFARA